MRMLNVFVLTTQADNTGTVEMCSNTASNVDIQPLEELPSAKSKSLASLEIFPFGFHAKTTHDAFKTLLQSRSDHFKLLPEVKNDDVWKRQPPDFRYIVFAPRPPKRNTVDSMKPWEYGTIPGQREITKRKKDRTPLPVIVNHNHKERESDIVTRFHIDRPFTAKKKFVSQGMYKPGRYQNPKPHDFRQYPSLQSLGLEEFVSNYDRDPNGVIFNSHRLNQIHGLSSEPLERDLVKARQMAPPMSAKNKWESCLILDKDVWPTKNAAFSRHRRRHRQAYSAFMELVERDITAQWSQERLDKLIQSFS